MKTNKLDPHSKLAMEAIIQNFIASDKNLKTLCIETANYFLTVVIDNGDISATLKERKIE